MLDGLFDRHGFLHAQSRADARLDLHPQIQRLRIAPHHRRHQRGTVGRNPDPHRADGRRGGAGHRGPLALQRRKRGIGRERNVDETTPGANGRQDPSAGPELRRQALLGRNFRLHPGGDLRKLPEGATVLDFAFDIHTSLGLTCSGGKVNNRPAAIRDVLHNGDIVEVLTQKNQKPKADWLGFVTTSKARTGSRPRRASTPRTPVWDGRIGTQTQELETAPDRR